MTDFPILRDLGMILVLAAALSLLARAVRVPTIIAYMAAGLILGPTTGLLHATERVDVISETGIALLLFLVGLELSLEKIRDVGRAALAVGGAQIGITIALGAGLGVLLGFDPMAAALLGLALTFSSTVVVVKLLHRRDEIATLHGRMAVGILLVQDVAVAVALTLLAGLGREGDVDAGSVGRGLLRAGLGMGALIGAAYVAVRWLLPRLLAWLSTAMEAVFIWSLTWCFGFILAAQALGLSVEIGAFIAGVGLAQLPHNEELVRRVHPLVDFFLAVFFVTLGVHMEPSAALDRWQTVLALSAFAVLLKPVLILLLMSRAGYGQATSFHTALTLGQISEFSLIVATMAVGIGLVGDEFLAVIGAVGLVTIGVSTALIEGGERMHELAKRAGIARLFRKPTRDEPDPPEELSDHVIVVGMNTLGRRLVEGFLSRGERVLAVDTDSAKLEGISDCAKLVGSTEYPAILEAAGLNRARLLVSALQIEDANNLLAWRARQAGVPSSIHAFDPGLADELRENGASHLMVSKYEGIRQVAAAMRRAGVID